MPLIIKGESYILPTEDNTQGPTGREIIEIEDAFGLDGLTLLGILGEDEAHPNPAYSKIKALYALAWICLTRAGKVVSIDDVLNTYSIDEIAPGDLTDPK
jgi:hypothetical protein